MGAPGLSNVLRVPPPNGSNGSKIVFATISNGICDDMKAQIKLKLKCMSQGEALNLFWMKVGVDTRNSLTKVEYIAETLNAEICQGLPLAFVAIGQALTRNPDERKHALSIMQNYPSRLSGMDHIFHILEPGMNHIFHILEPRYKRLEDHMLKDCLMYISILSCVITKDELIKLWIG
ncbi:hypothetical protein GH714_033572 [Hevea brasiliensis]|uniref:Uncharacterized protein n=1 Tax=Hevea brasiliensis TaxID=3981 RepID=A0A6A6NCB1_HEVBR|nr:hypothetical protein GH714_033572 [Hevea brasiliensis]